MMVIDGSARPKCKRIRLDRLGGACSLCGGPLEPAAWNLRHQGIKASLCYLSLTVPADCHTTPPPAQKTPPHAMMLSVYVQTTDYRLHNLPTPSFPPLWVFCCSRPNTSFNCFNCYGKASLLSCDICLSCLLFFHRLFFSPALRDTGCVLNRYPSLTRPCESSQDSFRLCESRAGDSCLFLFALFFPFLLFAGIFPTPQDPNTRGDLML